MICLKHTHFIIYPQNIGCSYRSQRHILSFVPMIGQQVFSHTELPSENAYLTKDFRNE